MNKHSEFHGAAKGALAPQGVRAEGKARSRRSLVAAARRLFMERGYEAATVRDIAAAAGLSTGAVFASFADKADLFSEVVRADAEAQVAAMRRAAAGEGAPAERLVELLAVGYAHHLPQLRLFRAAMAVSWSQGLAGALGDRPVREPVIGLIREILAETGLEPGAALDLMSETVWDVYVASFRHALYDGAGLEALKARLGRQIALLLGPRGG